MAIDAKELMQAPRFEGYGSFVAYRAGNGDWHPTFLFECFGGQISVEVEESAAESLPAAGSMFFIAGNVRYNPRNGTVSLAATEKKFVPEVTPEQFVAGLRISGVGVVAEKNSTSLNRQTFMSATLKWFGAIHQFKRLSPELFQRIPGKGGFVRFDLGLQVQSERNQAGQTIQLMFPALVNVRGEELRGGSIPSAAASPAGVSPAASVPPVAKPAASRV